MAVAAACGGNVSIVHGLDEAEANEILVTLDARQISGTKIKEEGRVVTWAVEVPNSSQREAMRLLVGNKLPKHRVQGLKEVYPAGGGGLIPTKSEEKAKYLMALQGEVERSLMSLPGIMQAHVSVVQPDKDIVRDLDTPPPPSTASVAIVYNAIDERGTAAVREDEVKNLVAASVEELKPANVTVVMKRNVPGTLISGGPEAGTGDAPIVASRQFGINLADTASVRKLQIYAGTAGIIAVVCLMVGIGGIVRSMNLKRRVGKAEADLTSFRKAAKRETQTGLQQQG